MKRFIPADSYRPLWKWGNQVERQHVKSSNIKSVGYDQTSNTLEIEFNNGRTYQYFEVPNQIYLSLIEAASKGKYFHNSVKSRFEFKQIL
jgi:hypothetical protein